MQQATALLERIRLEEEAVGQLQQAMEAENMNELQAYLQQMVEMGLDDEKRFHILSLQYKGQSRLWIR